MHYKISMKKLPFIL